MTTFTKTKLRMPAAALGAESPLPPVAGVQNQQQQTRSILDEDDELFIGYGFLDGSWPYRQQDGYGEELLPSEESAVVLENRYLRAEFLLGWGGKLRSLVDKERGCELLFCNPVMRPRNLAVRNAWTSGGVEWNCGLVGHSPFTCSPVFAARAELDDKTPVLRVYEFERIRAIVYQIDFFLPEASKLLYARVRIVNPRRETLPMYWWSNISVVEKPLARVVMPARETFTNRDGIVSKTTVPVSGGVDITYPTNNRESIDYFWKLTKGARPFICHLDENGYGLVQMSTARLQGRKLFVWGQQPGGTHWQRFLSGEGCDGRYVEIQAGLAHTQYECIPMPPETAWEWLEGYGAMQADPARIHGEWAEAVREATARADELAAPEAMEAMLNDTRAMSKAPALEQLQWGGGWGALECLRRESQGEKAMCPHLDFGVAGAEQTPWLRLLEEGAMGDMDVMPVPESWMKQPEWLALLDAATQGKDKEHAYAWLQLGMARLAERDFEKARECLRRSLALRPSPWALYGLGQLERIKGDPKAALENLRRAAGLAPHIGALSVVYARALLDQGLADKTLAFATACPEAVRALPRMRLAYCEALTRTGDPERARAMLPALRVPDVRENELSVTDLWFLAEEEAARLAGRPFDREHAVPPDGMDFRTMIRKS